MFRSPQATTREYGDIRSNPTYTNSRRSPARSISKNPSFRHDTFTNQYALSPASDGWSNQPPEYPNSIVDPDRYTIINDSQDDKCTLSTRQSFETALNEEDCISFFSSPTPTPMNQDSDGKDDSDNSEAGVIFPDVENNTMANFGPKMRFVSPPPWESQDQLYDDDRDDNISISDGLSVFSGRFGPRKHREPEKVSIRSLALASMRTPSPTPTTSSRRSPYGKFNPSASQSLVSLSTPTSAREAPWASRSTLESPSSERPSFSLTSRDKGAPASTQLAERSLKQKVQAPLSPLSQDNVSPIESSDSPNSSGQYTHPYANPDVIPISDSSNFSSSAEARHHHHHHHQQQQQQQQQQLRQSNESDFGYVRRASEPATVVSNFRKGSAGDSPMSQFKPSLKPVLAKQEETDITLLPPTLRCKTDGSLPPARSSQVSHSSVPFPDSPTTNLVTLEEAQHPKWTSPELPLQTRVRTGSSLVAGFGLATGVDFELKRNQPSSTLPPGDSSSTIRESNLSNARQRTVSSSKLSAAADSSPPKDDTGSTKTLKHRKSGLLKLFGKDKNAAKESFHKTDVPSAELIPPVPKRAPPSSLSVVVTSPSMSFPEMDINTQKPRSSSRDHKPSPLLSPNVLDSAEVDGKVQGSRSLPNVRPILSAPPSQTTFETLSLRPVSTVFSAKFADLFSALDDPEGALTPPVMPAALKPYGGGGGSPTTSDFSSRSNSSEYPLTPSSTTLPGAGVIFGSRQEDTLASLQAQISNMRKNHQREIWELDSQIKELKQENEELRNTMTCEACRNTKREGRVKSVATNVVDRPRPKISRDARSVFGGN